MTRDDPFMDAEDWRWRWLVKVAPSGAWSNCLHRIASFTEREDDHYVGVIGAAACGLEGRFDMPGIFSRMGRRRCSHCCDAIGIPRGEGAPYNHDILEPGEPPKYRAKAQR